MTTLSTPLPRLLAPLDVFVLSIGEERIGWTRDHRIGFTGFVDLGTAATAAWVAHVALARRRGRDWVVAPAMSDVPALTVAASGGDEWIWGRGLALARLIRPGTATPAVDGLDPGDARRAWWSIEVALPPDASELDVASSALVVHRGLRRSGLSWEALDVFRARADAFDAAPSDPSVQAARPAAHATVSRIEEWRRRFAIA